MQSPAVYVELSVPGLDHGQNLKLLVSKRERFTPSALRYGRHSRTEQAKRNSLSLKDDPDVAQISAAIESTLAARLPAILDALAIPRFRIGETSASCVCFRNGAYFRSHVDVRRHGGRRRLTWVYYLNSEPRRFTGGDLLIGDPDAQRAVVEPAHGKLVVFPSASAHEVTTVSLDPDDFGAARFTLTGFISSESTRADRLAFALKGLRRLLGGARRRRRRGDP